MSETETRFERLLVHLAVAIDEANYFLNRAFWDENS